MMLEEVLMENVQEILVVARRMATGLVETLNIFEGSDEFAQLKRYIKNVTASLQSAFSDLYDRKNIDLLEEEIGEIIKEIHRHQRDQEKWRTVRHHNKAQKPIMTSRDLRKYARAQYPRARYGRHIDERYTGRRRDIA
jgi:hypothetical protein